MVLRLEYRGLKCAGKQLYPVLYEQGVGDTVRRFEEECRLLAQMRHPNIVQFIGVYFEEGSRVPILVMEFLPTTLARCIDLYGVLPEEVSYSILHDVALGLYHLHSHTPPIVHRDLSANNVLLDSNMAAKISDLGVARILNLTPQQMSRMTHAPGTPAYMPPEAMRANAKYDTSIDEFSYGILMIHVLCGRWPLPVCEAARPDPRNSTNNSAWEVLPNTPFYGPAAATFGASLLAVGGIATYNWPLNLQQRTAAVQVYSPCSNAWIHISDLPAPLMKGGAAMLSPTELLVIGDWNADRLNSVYKGLLQIE